MKKLFIIILAILAFSCKKQTSNAVNKTTTTSKPYAQLEWNQIGTNVIHPSQCWYSINGGNHITPTTITTGGAWQQLYPNVGDVITISSPDTVYLQIVETYTATYNVVIKSTTTTFTVH